jgi:hypothetical protein
MSTPVPGTDPLSPLAHRLIKLNPNAYTAPVVHGGGNAEAREILDMLQPDQLLAVPVLKHDDARAMLAGLWLWHDWLDDSHTISQGLHSATGSLWHAIMHRREGDFGNSKYWYRQTGPHPVLAAVGQTVSATINALPADKSLLRLFRDGWDPYAFVDLAEEVARRPNDPRAQAVAMVQRTEWQLLFDHCTRGASGM